MRKSDIKAESQLGTVDYTQRFWIGNGWLRYKERCSLNQISCTSNCQKAASIGRNFFWHVLLRQEQHKAIWCGGEPIPKQSSPSGRWYLKKQQMTRHTLCFPKAPIPEASQKVRHSTWAKEPAAPQDLHSRWAEDMEQSCHRVNGRWKRGGWRKPRHFSPSISGHLSATLPATASSPWFNSAHFAEHPTSLLNRLVSTSSQKVPPSLTQASPSLLTVQTHTLTQISS